MTSLNSTKPHKQSFTPKLRTWKLRNPVVKKGFLEAVETDLSNNSNVSTVEETWQLLKNSLLKAADKVWCHKEENQKEAILVVG